VYRLTAQAHQAAQQIDLQIIADHQRRHAHSCGRRRNALVTRAGSSRATQQRWNTGILIDYRDPWPGRTDAAWVHPE
jgi:hypothetical protein